MTEPAGKIRVTHVISDLRMGGAENMLAKLAKALPALGVEMTIVSLGAKHQLGAEIEAAGVPVHSLGLASTASVITGTFALAGLIREFDPDVVQTWLYHADLIGLFANLAAGRRALCWNLRCSNMELVSQSRRTDAVRNVLARLSRFPDLILANSHAGLAAHIALGYRPRASLVVPNGFDTDLFRPSAEARERVRSELAIPADAFLVGMIARVDPMKDHATFLEAARIFAARQPKAFFVLAGAGTEPAGPLALASRDKGLEHRIRWLGRRSDAHELFAALNVATLSSAYGEGFPNVLGEALACGTPCVATDVGDAAAIIANNGIVVAPRAPAELAVAWQRMYEADPEWRSTIGADGRRRMVAEFGIDGIAQQYAELYRGLAGKYRAIR